MLYKSEKQIKNKITGKVYPVFTFDSDTEANDGYMVWVHWFDDGARNTRYISKNQRTCLVYHIHHIESKNPDRIQRLVDSGELYDYLMDLYDRVDDAVERQRDIWLENDAKYKEVVRRDPVEAAGIVNMYEMQAKEVVYEAMI